MRLGALCLFLSQNWGAPLLLKTSLFVKSGLTKCALLSYVILFISSGHFGLHICLSYGFSLRGVVG